MTTVKITSDTKVSKLTFDGKAKDYGIGDGLYIRVRPSSKTWLFKRKINGKRKVKTIGQFPDIKINEAKRKALQLKNELSSAISSTKIKEVAERYYETSIIGTVNKKGKPHKRPHMTWRYLQILVDEYGHLNIDSITPDQIERLIMNYKNSIAKNGRGDGARAANQCFITLKTFMKTVSVARLFSGTNPIDLVNPNIAVYSYDNGRDRVLTDDEIRMIFESEHPNARTLRFILLTGLRISETRHGYLDGDYWRLPKEFSKNEIEHWSYLPPLAKAQLPLPRMTDTNLQAWLRRWLESKGYSQQSRFTPHDLRRTFSTRLHDHNRDTDQADTIGDIPPYIVEKCLNHKLSGVMAVYNRAEYKAQRIEAAKLMEQIVNEILEGE